MKVLAIGAHFDDVELGCGGSLLKHKRNGDDINVLVVTKSNYSSETSSHSRTEDSAFYEGCKSAQLIGANLYTGKFETLKLTASKELVNFLCRKIADIAPDIVYTHFVGDQHLDHQAVAKASLIATRNVKEVVAYMSNVYDTNPTFKPNYFVDISDFFEEKLQLIDCFESEKETHLTWKKQLECLNGLYGVKEHVEYTEAFEVIRICK